MATLTDIRRKTASRERSALSGRVSRPVPRLVVDALVVDTDQPRGQALVAELSSLGISALLSNSLDDAAQRARSASVLLLRRRLGDTDAFADDRYFDVFAEYAKASEEDILIRITELIDTDNYSTDHERSDHRADRDLSCEPEQYCQHRRSYHQR